MKQSHHAFTERLHLLNYNTRFNNPLFYNDDFYAASDHDPLLIGLNLGDPDTVVSGLQFKATGFFGRVKY